MITRIEAYRYRCFERLGLDLGPYQVLVGMNGSGKSTLIDIPVLLGEMLDQRSIHTPIFNARGRLPVRAETPRDILFGRTGDTCWLAIEARLPEALADRIERATFPLLSKREQLMRQKNPARGLARVRYELALRLKAEALEVSHEGLFLYPADRSLIEAPPGLWLEGIPETHPLVRSVIRRTPDGVTIIFPEVPHPDEKKEIEEGRLPVRANVPTSAPALAGVLLDVSQFAACEWLRTFLAKGTLPISLDIAAMRKAQRPPGADFKVQADGTTLPWSIMELQLRELDFQEWMLHIKNCLPNFTTVRAHKREDDGHAYLEVEYRSGIKVRSIGLSDGTWSFLALSILPYLRNVHPLITVEEPENGIHPKAIEAILESLKSMRQSQAWVTTHSPIVVAATDLDHLLCMSQVKSGGVEVVRGGDHPHLKEWKGKPDLSVLFSAGVL
jgi:hypothetical protein